MKRVLLLLALFLAAGPLFAADYHVAPTGKDDNAGTAVAPFLTIQKAADLVKPGDSVLIAAGTYKGAAFYGGEANVAGPHLPVTVKGGPGVLIRTGTAREHGITAEGWNGFVVDGLDIADLGAKPNGTGVWFAGVKNGVIRNVKSDNTHEWGIQCSYCRNLLIENCRLTRARKQHGIYVGNSSSDVVVKNCEMLGNNFCGIQCNGDFTMDPQYGLEKTGEIRNLKIENCRFGYNSIGGGADVNLDAVVGATIDNCISIPTRGKGNCITLFHSDYNPSKTKNVMVKSCTFVAGPARYNVIRVEDASDVTFLECTLVHAGFPARADAGLLELFWAGTGKLERFVFTGNKWHGGVVVNDVAGKTLADLDFVLFAANTAADVAAVVAALPAIGDPGPLVAPVTPPAPVPVPVEEPPLPESADAAAFIDPSLVQTDEPGGGFFLEYKTQRRFGPWDGQRKGEAFSNTSYYSSLLFNTGRNPPPGFGMRWRGVFKAQVSGVHEFLMEGQGGLDVDLFDGPVELDGTVTQHGVLRKRITVSLEAGKFYSVNMGVMTQPDTVPLLHLRYRNKANPTFVQIPASASYMLKSDSARPDLNPVPAPTPSPAPAPAPTPAGFTEIRVTIQIPNDLIDRIFPKR